VPAFQIDGLFSGLQTGAMLDKMISLERQPVMRLNSKVAVLKQRKQTLSELRSKLSTFESVLANVMKAATLNKKATTVAKSDGTASTAVSATAGLNAANGPFQVTVNQLATASTATSTAKIGDGVSAGSVLEDAGLVVALATTESAGTSGTFSINGTSVSVDYAVDTLNAVVSRVNSTVSGVTATITDADGTANPSGNYLKLSSASAITLGSGAVRPPPRLTFRPPMIRLVGSVTPWKEASDARRCSSTARSTISGLESTSMCVESVSS